MAFVILRETFAPTLLQQKAARLRKLMDRDDLVPEGHSDTTPFHAIVQAIQRPLKLLVFSPIMILFAVLMGLAYGLMYVLYTTISEVFEEQYGFSIGLSGLAYLGAGIGTFIGLGILIAVGDRLFIRLSRGGERKPEYRLPPLLLGYWLFPAGFFVFGWTVQYRVYWLVPVVANGLTGIGVISVYVSHRSPWLFRDEYMAFVSLTQRLDTAADLPGGLLSSLCGVLGRRRFAAALAPGRAASVGRKRSVPWYWEWLGIYHPGVCSSRVLARGVCGLVSRREVEKAISCCIVNY